jgi:uncharacterized RmlC-like cupin family protein
MATVGKLLITNHRGHDEQFFRNSDYLLCWFRQADCATRGSERQAAVAPQLGIESTLWGLVEVMHGAGAGIPRHNEQQTSHTSWQASAKSDRTRMANSAASAKADDFDRVPTFLPHMQINPSISHSFRWVVVGSTATPIVVNLPGDAWRLAGREPVAA